MSVKNTGEIRIGTSGWSYDGWRGAFYEQSLSKNEWLSYYSSHFRTVEINSSFYRLPTTKGFEKWRLAVGDGFDFAVKASRYITHVKKLKDSEEAWLRFQESVSGLGEKLGPILFEFPPSWKKNAARLTEFLAILPANMRYAFEFRNDSWFDSEIFSLLEGKSVALVTSDSPHFPRSFERTADFSYIRFHGGRALYGSEYSGEELRQWAQRIIEMAEHGRCVYAYFNNDAFAFAPKNARELIELIEDEKKAARRAA